MEEEKKIHNFCIIAHIDHGKSTLADRMLELTNTVEKRQMKEQMLDTMDLERERGITIKLQPVRMEWKEQILNLIDTPGHVDFQYEVSRSLQAVEGAVVLVDATQGVQAQTMANLYLAIEQGLEVIPVINKIDLPAADVEGVKEEMMELLGVEEDEILTISAKTGEGVKEVLDAIVQRVKSVSVKKSKALRCLIFDSVYDDYKGVVAYVRVVEGEVKAGDQISFLGTGISDRAVEVGVFVPDMKMVEKISTGEIGYIATGLKNIQQARVGDTISLAVSKDKVEPLAGFEIPQAKVFAGVYPESGENFGQLREAVAKLQLNDASLSVQQEQSEALGQGFRCGFLGMLHLEIVQERLLREYGMELVITTPSVLYKVVKSNGDEVDVHTPSEFPDPSQIELTREQFVRVEVLTPDKYLGAVFELMKSHEAELQGQEHLGAKRVVLKYEAPLRELVVDLYDQLKSVTSGYGSLNYEMLDWREADVVKIGISINEDPVEALSVIVPRKKCERFGRRMAKKLKEVIPRQQYAVPIQATVGGSVIARETLSALRKNVTSGLYGGDITRKRKVLEKQKKGKKRLASHGSIKLPPETYVAVLKR
jgi:GTP-binding protein LepA